MINRILDALKACASAGVLIVLAGNLAFAETTVRVDFGIVEAIEIFRAADNQPVNVGTVLGGLAGGVIGHQIGSGRGNTAATVIGAIGGAAVGTEIEKKRVQGSRYRITVRLDSGSALIVEDSRDVNLRVGDRVRVENDRLSRV
jgi:outer membrane lipoprotein SlyB